MMKNNSKKFLKIITILCLIIGISCNSLAHSGRTDSNGGHRDNKNKSGLGSYHYHCGGHEAHLHNNGICPYTSASYQNKNTTVSSTTESSKEESVTTTSNIQSIQTSAYADDEKPIEVSNVEIAESITSMKIGESTKLTAIINPENAEYKSVTWSSSDEDIATVSSTGKVVALREGMVNITVTTHNGKTDTITIKTEEIKNEEKEQSNTITVLEQSNEMDDAEDNEIEETDSSSGVLGLALICGGVYFGYKKFKK